MDILIMLFSSVISALLGALCTIAANLYKVVKPARNLWQIAEPKELFVIVATSCKDDTGEYLRAATGIGQVRALTHATESLKKAYRNLTLQNIYLSIENLYKNIESDILLLGSPKNNKITEKFLNKLCTDQPAFALQSDMGEIYWHKHSDDGNWVDETYPPFLGRTEENKEKKENEIVEDYGLVIRARNPFNKAKERTVVIFSGHHTYGTEAAARYFVEQMQGDSEYKKARREKKENIVALVHTDVVDGRATNIERVENMFYAWE